VANGGVPFGLFVAWVLGGPVALLWPAFLGAVATATSDTWATEIGTSFRSEARLITSGRIVPAGTSGGITIHGMIGGVAGAAVIGLTAFLVPADIGSGRWVIPVAGSIGGLLGCLLDSVLGATVQAHWRDAEGHVSEKAPQRADRDHLRVRGVGWVNNDAVNALSALGGATLAAVVAILAG
jgi:uncharacterized protein (TIGR00297 family)